MARLLILGGGLRGRRLAGEVLAQGHAARIVTRAHARRAKIEAVGAECFIGDPNRLGTLRGAPEGVTVACWLLATAAGPSEELGELHAARLPAFLGAAIDSTVRAFVYEEPADIELPQRTRLAEGARQVREIAAANAIPATALTADPRDLDSWLRAARATLSLYL